MDTFRIGPLFGSSTPLWTFTIPYTVYDKNNGKKFGGRSLIGPLYVPDTERGLVLLPPVECDALTTLPMSGALVVGTVAILGDETVFTHVTSIGLTPINNFFSAPLMIVG